MKALRIFSVIVFVLAFMKVNSNIFGNSELIIGGRQYTFRADSTGWSLWEDEILKWSGSGPAPEKNDEGSMALGEGILSLIAQWQCPGNVFSAGQLRVYDLNSDGQENLVYSNWGETTYVYKSLSDNQFECAFAYPNPVGSYFTYFLCAGDGDEDGNPEMVFGTGTSGVPRDLFFVESRGAGLYPDSVVLVLPENNIGVNYMLMDDLDEDGYKEYIGVSQGNHDCLLSIWENNGDNSFVQVYTLGYGYYDVCGQFATGDFDGDGNREIVLVVAGDNVGSIHVIECTGDNQYQEVWSDYSIPTNNLYWVASGPDLDRDGKGDFVVAGGEGFPTAVWSFLVYESAGNDSFQLVWTHQRTSGIVDGGVVTGDIDGDGFNELMCQVPNYTQVFQYAGDDSLEIYWELGTTAVGQSGLRLLGSDLDSDGKGEAVWWTTSDPGNLVIFENVSTDVEEEPALSEGVFGFESFPNPLREKAVIRFCLSEISSVGLSLYDLTGREIRRLLNGQIYGPGSHEAIIDGSDLPPGQYFCRLTCGRKTQNYLLVLTK